MSIQTQLDELFLKWRNEQMNLDNDQDILNFPAYIFNPDGLAGDERQYLENADKKKKVLYIFKESHTSMETYQACTFWFQKQIYKGRKGSLLIRRVQEMQDVIMKRENASLEAIAVMNINKNGGFNVTPMDKLERYADKFSWFIKEQIKIINPNYIVCGRTFSIVNNLVKQMDDHHFIVVDMIHPSAPGKYLKQGEYRSKFIDRLQEAENEAATKKQ